MASAPTSAAVSAPRNSASSRAPSRTLSPPGAIRSLQEADSSLRELGELDAREASLKAEFDQFTAAAKQRYIEKLFVVVDREPIAIADRRKDLLKMLEAFADESRGEILEGDAKSRELNHGTIGWRKSAPCLAPATKKGLAGGNKEQLEKILGFIAERVEKFKLFAAGTFRFLRIKVEFDKTALLKAIQAEEIDRAELRSAGFLLDEGDDQFFAEPKKQALESHTGAA